MSLVVQIKPKCIFKSQASLSTGHPLSERTSCQGRWGLGKQKASLAMFKVSCLPFPSSGIHCSQGERRDNSKPTTHFIIGHNTATATLRLKLLPQLKPFPSVSPISLTPSDNVCGETPIPAALTPPAISSHDLDPLMVDSFSLMSRD